MQRKGHDFSEYISNWTLIFKDEECESGYQGMKEEQSNSSSLYKYLNIGFIFIFVGYRMLITIGAILSLQVSNSGLKAELAFMGLALISSILEVSLKCANALKSTRGFFTCTSFAIIAITNNYIVTKSAAFCLP